MKLKIALILTLVLFISMPAISQDKSKKKVLLRGQVVNQDGQPVNNVMIFVDGKNTDLLTDAKGEFKLKVKPNVKKISFLSFEDGGFELEYIGQRNLVIVINHDTKTLSTVPTLDIEAVETGYGKVSSDDQSTSVSTIKNERFENRLYKDVYEMIAGEAAGVTVEGTSIRIRGISSLYGSNDPLLIVDGSPVVSFIHISPNDVESINVLKGSAASIYGVRGANGVVIINTKRGRK